MLDRDPNADQPPDPSLSRPRARSHKPKNAPKKQPQRGLGVAQLEKLRLEEQSKQQEAVCLASLQPQNLHHLSHYAHLQQQEQLAPHLHYQHQNYLQQHYQSQASPLCLPQQIKHMETSFDKSSFAEPRFPLPFGKLNPVQNSFLPLTTLINGSQTRPLPLLIPQQQLPAEDEVSTSPVSQVHDLYSPGTTHMRPSSAESRLSPLLTRASPASLVEKSWLNHLYDREPNKEKDSSITPISLARCNGTDTKMQGQDHSLLEGLYTGITNFHGENRSIDSSLVKLYMQNEGGAAPFTESLIRFQPAGAIDTHFPSKTHLESPPLGIVPGGVQMKELSSFQTISLCPTWSSVDKVFNRKRSWACTQELDRPAEACKGVDLNTSADEMESEVTEQDPNVPLPFTIRDDWNLLPGASAEKLLESKCKVLLSADKSCHQCGSTKVERPLHDACANGAAFLSLRKQSVNLEKWEVEAPGEFLTLGPSSSSIQKMTSAHLGSGSCSSCPVSRSLTRNVSSWQSQPIPLEQVRSPCSSTISRMADNDVFSLEYGSSYLHTPLQQRRVGFSDFFAFNKVEALQQESSTDESLDLELRLSI